MRKAIVGLCIVISSVLTWIRITKRLSVSPHSKEVSLGEGIDE